MPAFILSLLALIATTGPPAAGAPPLPSAAAAPRADSLGAFGGSPFTGFS